MPTPGPDVNAIRRTIRQQAGRLRMRLLWGFLMLIGLLVVLPVALLAALDLALPLREPMAMWGVVVCHLAAAVAFVVGIFWLRRHMPTTRQVALTLEDKHPAFMDSLITAVELSEKPPTDWNRLDLALLTKVEGDLAQVPVRRLLAPTPARVAQFAMATIVVLAGFILLPRSPLMEKAIAHGYERITGEATGLLVSPGPTEVGAGDDLLITARILRGEDRATITIIDGMGRFEYEMHGSGEEGQHAYEIYGIEESFEYYVTTPTLRSASFPVRVFAKPAATAVAIHVDPPAYTRDTPQHYTDWRNVVAPVGSTVTIRVDTNMAVDAALALSDGEAITLQQRDDKSYEASFMLTRSFGYRLSLDDTRGHVVTGDREWRFECLPDYPPNIQILTPDDGLVQDVDGQVTFSAEVTDDYGMETVQLVYAVNGGDEIRSYLFRVDPNATEPTKQEMVVHALPLTDMVQYGDVITWWIEATDKALPKPNVGASEPRFIEIRPPQDEQPQEPSDQEMNMENAGQLTVSDLIEDQKQLIRSNFALRRLQPGPDKDDATQSVAKGASDLLLAARQRYNDLKEAAGTDNFGRAGELFRDALEHMEQAESLLTQGESERAMSAMRQALASLIALEVELTRNAQMMAQQQSGQSGQQQQQQSAENQQQEQDMQEMAEQKLEQIQEAMEQLDTIIQRQENLNEQLEDRNANSDTPETQDLARRQEQINRDADAVHEQLRQMPEAGAADRELARAMESMQSAQKNLQRGQGSTAQKDGEMSEEFLHRSRDLLGQLQKDLSGSKLQAADRLLDAIREGQREVREHTEAAQAGAPNAPSKEALTNAQQALRENMEKLNDQLAEARDSLEAQNPSAANNLTEAMQAMSDSGMEGKMRRAENALRYGRFDRATPYQKEAEQSMDQLAEALAEAIRQGEAPSTEQLAQMLQETLQNLAELKDSMESATSQRERERLQQQIDDSLQELAERLGDPQMQGLAQRSKSIQFGDGDGAGEAQMVEVLEQTARILETRLMESMAAQKLRLSRLSGRQAPDEYRKLVDEYFKNLSDVAE